MQGLSSSATAGAVIVVPTIVALERPGGVRPAGRHPLAVEVVRAG